jgi:hypothetical protein
VTADDTYLDDGYGLRTASADNLLNDFVQEGAASFATFAAARGDRHDRVDGVGTLVDAQSPVPFFNRAVLEQPMASPQTVLDALRAFYGQGGSEAPFLLDSSWPTPDLSAHGFTLMGHPPLMFRPAAPLPDAPAELHIVPVADDQTALDFEHVLAYGYPAPQMQPVTKPTVLPPAARVAPGWHHFVGYVNDKPVTAGSGYEGDRLVRVDNIATLDEARGRGYGLAITAAATAVNTDKPATLIASDLGRPIYERLGYVALLRVTYWLGTRTTSVRL